jgi:hypothetical protein
MKMLHFFEIVGRQKGPNLLKDGSYFIDPIVGA